MLLLPGVGTVGDLRRARADGALVARIATHCTEADVSVQHFAAARDLGMETVGFLMLAHRLDPAGLARQARIMVDAGAECVYVVDSAGALVLSYAQARVQALVTEIGRDAQVGFHGHENLGCGVANSVLAARAGAAQIDGSARRFGAGAGNTPVEAFAAVTERLGLRTGIDTLKIIDAAEEVVAPAMPGEPMSLSVNSPRTATSTADWSQALTWPELAVVHCDQSLWIVAAESVSRLGIGGGDESAS